jgi:HSP20 family protein
MTLERLKDNVDSFWDNLAEGWRHLRTATASALTRFRPGAATDLPAAADIDDDLFRPARSWAMLGGDVFEDDSRLVVRLELPGLSKEEIDIEVRNEALIISGEKRFDHETTQGRWRVMQCAYGSFRRVVPLQVGVKADQASATYKNGVLRVELPKAEPGKPLGVTVKVS